MKRAGGESGQAAIFIIGLFFVLAVGALALGSFGSVVTAKSSYQKAADLASLSAGRVMVDNYSRLFTPPYNEDGSANSDHLEKGEYLAMAKSVAELYAQRNGVAARRVSFPDGDSFAPTQVKVAVGKKTRVAIGVKRKARIPVEAAATAEIAAVGEYEIDSGYASGGGYSGPLAYRQGKPMRPDVALAFDRMYRAARASGISLIVTSAFRSDAEQAELFRRHPDPKWVAPPGRSLHRMGTELDLGPAGAYGWLVANAPRFGFIKRYSWEPWHFGYTRNPRSTPGHLRNAHRDGRSAVPSFVPQKYVATISRAAQRYNVSAALLSAQLYAESNFNPFSRSRAGAQGIAQFMPGTAKTYGLKNPYDPVASIDAQARFMRDLLRRFSAVNLALAAYNAGPGAVASCGCVPNYPETRAYVAKILALMGGAVDISEPTLEVRLVE